MVYRILKSTDSKSLSYIYSVLTPYKIILTCFLICSSSGETKADSEEPAISINEKTSPSSAATILKDKFADLINNNDAFVDKTELIKELLDYDDKVILITRPRKWGKSINLEMMKSFLEITLQNDTNIIMPPQDTPNYRLFKNGELLNDDGTLIKLKHPLLITKHEEFLDQHLAQYSVIHASFKGWRGFNYNKTEGNFHYLMANIFQRYNYIKKIMQGVIDSKSTTPEQMKQASKDLKEYMKIEEKQGDLSETETCISFLSKILHQYIAKPVIILIDDYEYPLIEAILQDEYSFKESKIIQFIEFYHDFLKSLVGGDHVKKVILTGVLRLVEEQSFHDSKTIPKYGGIDNRFFPFYGFTKQEVDLLIDSRKGSLNTGTQFPYGYGNQKQFNWFACIPHVSKDIRQQVHDKYSGYESHKPSGVKLYNPYSIMNFLRTNKISNYWMGTDSINEEKRRIPIMSLDHKAILKIVPLRSHFVSILMDGEASINGSDLHFHTDDYLKLRNLLPKSDVKMEKQTADVLGNLALSYLWAHGYFTFSHSKGSKLVQALGLKNTNVVWFRVPNEEIWESSRVVKEWHLFYEKPCDDEIMHTQAYFDDPILLHWHRYVHDDGNLMMSKSIQFIKGICNSYGLLNGVDIVLNSLKQTSLVGTFEEYFKSRVMDHPDMALYKKERVVLIKITFGEKSAEKALQMVKKYESIVQQSNITGKIKFIGINVGENWQICSYTLCRVSKGWFNIDGDDAINYAGIGYYYISIPTNKQV